MSWNVDLSGTLGSLRMAARFAVEPSPALVIGPNGAGKSTLLRAIAGARLGMTGRVALSGRPLLDTAQGIDAPPHERRIGYLPQGFALFPHMNVRTNVAFGCGRGEDARRRAQTALERFGANHLGDRQPRALSGGESQRVALARALATEPDGLLLDEPLSSLDPASRRRMRADLADHLRAAGRPALVVTHDVRDVRALGGVVLVMEAGTLVQTGTWEELAASPESEYVAEFFEDGSG